MKQIKYLISAIFLFAAVWSCTEDELGNADFVDTIVAPTEVSAMFNVTQDNTGLVTIAPTSQGAVTYTVDLGDGSDPITLKQGESIKNIFAEGEYQVKITAIGVTGLTTSVTLPLVVSFKAPENLVVEILNDEAVSKQVNVTATADNAINFDVYFGVEGVTEPITGVIGETVSYVYPEPGIYTIKVVAKGAAIETTEYIEEFEVTEIEEPLEKAPTPPYRNEVDVVSIFSDAYTNITVNEWNPGWGQSTTLTDFEVDGDNILKYDFLNYTGIVTDYDNPTNLAQMEFVHFDYWTNDAESLSLKIVNTSQADGTPEKESEIAVGDITAGEWVSVEIPLSDFTTNMSGVTQFLFVSNGVTVFIDNFYFYKQPTTVSEGIVGVWKLAPIAGALKVGPNPNDGSWWANSAEDVTGRDCLFDDSYVFGADGTFKNILDGSTWVEGWQGGSDSCATPVAPHDGSNPATFVYDEAAGKVTLNGLGAYLGIPKAYDGGELGSPADAPSAINYDVTLSNNDSAMTVVVNIGSGYWTFELVKDGAPAYSPLEGTWVVAPEAGSLGVGPGQGDTSWWTIDAAGVTQRACFFDDTFVFGADGSFMNVLGADTWIEGWQGGTDACGVPVAPHDGMNPATYTYDEAAGKLTLNGIGAYLGIPKAYNEGELASPADAPASITYDVTLANNDSEMTVDIWVGGDAWWRFKMVKEGTSTGGGSGTGGGTSSGTQIDLPVDFESATIDYTLTDFGENLSSIVEDPTNASNTVAKVVKTAAATTWAGTTIGTDTGFATNIPISLTNSIITVRVWSPDAGAPIRLKIEDANDATHTCETEVNTTVAGGWETIEFDFTNQATGTELLSVGLDNGWVYNKASIFFNFGTDGATAGEKTYYFDDVIFINN
ncbi:hypothetical protein SAMN05444411_11252 [Lutibacter oricola]|uniref:PKD domain-containing protein n=1 Tax=Lutibacter oricola TaxID=762486 RepID=A0A1H3FTL7_9FLAO|nr:hypothetical protein [Lutibacter oricola]SDX94270.1 hypothetical protein SAMN05444411_11252 [Lutibacter oricola]